MLRRPPVWIALVLALLVAAGAAWQRRGRDEVRAVPFRLADLGPIDLGAPIGKRIRLQKSLDLLLGERRFVIPPGRMTVIVSPGPRSSTGYGVRVLSVTEERRRIVVRVREEAPRLGEKVEARVTYPYAYIVIPLSRKRVQVSWAGR